MLGWLVVEQRRDGKPTTLGAASGAVAGLVGITPACGFVEPLGGAAIGFAAGLIAALAVRLKYRFGFDDSLDVVAVHGIGGLTGLVATGLLATTAVNAAGADGLFYGGGLSQLGRQALAAIVTIGYSGGLTYAIACVLEKTVGLRATRDDELAGIDEAEHAETGYDFGRVGSHLTAAVTRPRTRLPPGRSIHPGERIGGPQPGDPPAAECAGQQGAGHGQDHGQGDQADADRRVHRHGYRVGAGG